MESITQKLAHFAAETRFEDLPPEVTQEVKRVLLDSIGCAIAGLGSDKGKFAIQLAERLAGPAEATIIGVGNSVSCASAAFANAELINSLDWDATVGGHTVPGVIPPALALAEWTSSSGEDLIIALALSLEVAARLGEALIHVINITRGGSAKARVSIPPVCGYGHAIFGGAIGTGKILKLDHARMSHVLGIAGCICPVPHMTKWISSLPRPMTKYCMMGWVSHGAVISALLAEMGYTGDITVLDGEYGFGRYYNPIKWEPSALTEGLGEKWRLLAIGYKPYPCCRVQHSALDCFIQIIDKNAFMPEDIEKVTVWLVPTVNMPMWADAEVMTHIDAQFAVPYAFAAAAYRVQLGSWQNSSTIHDQKIREFMKKVVWKPYRGWGKAVLEDARRWPTKVEVLAKGKRFSAKSEYPRGGWAAIGGDFCLPAAEARMSDDELVNKFKDIASKILPQDVVEATVRHVLQLEKVANIAEVISQIHPATEWNARGESHLRL